jgi:hypothetical protein
MMPVAFWILIVITGVLAVVFFLKWFARRNRVKMFSPRDMESECAKKLPYFRPEVVQAKVKSLFPNHDSAEILRLLEIVPSFWGVERTQLNILKLSNGDMDQLHNYIAVASSDRDFLEVIDLAEYPEFSRINADDIDTLPYEELKRLIGRDTRQYLEWLKKK